MRLWDQWAFKWIYWVTLKLNGPKYLVGLLKQ